MCNQQALVRCRAELAGNSPILAPGPKLVLIVPTVAHHLLADLESKRDEAPL